MIEIELTKGYVAIVDKEDKSRVTAHKWTALVAKRKHGIVVYGYRRPGQRGNQATIYLHRFILDAPDGIPVDHINGNGLDCRRDNLRLATKRLNATNILRAMPPSGYRGVFFDKSRQLFRAEAGGCYIGRYTTAQEAARAYDKVALEEFGEFARLNFPDGDSVGHNRRVQCGKE